MVSTILGQGCFPSDCEGERGERGKRGKRGKRGERGHHGHDGHDGRDGPTGPTGPTGTTGPEGSTGATGPGSTGGNLLKFSGAVTGAPALSFSYRLPDAGNTALVILGSPPPTVELHYPIAAPITVSSFAALITSVVPPGGSVFFRLLQNNFSLLSIPFGPGEGGFLDPLDPLSGPKCVNFPPVIFAACALISVQVEVNEFPATFIASATVGLT